MRTHKQNTNKKLNNVTAFNALTAGNNRNPATGRDLNVY